MDTAQRVFDILTAAEKGLAALVGEATGAGRYEQAGIVLQLVAEQKALGQRARRELDPRPAGGTGPAPAAPVAAARVRPRKDAYPRFLREGEALVKIGWSKSERAEYEHKCPRSVLPLLAAAIARAGANGKRFGMDKVLPLTDTDGREVPAYQAYLALAFLRSIGLLEQHGRQGYTLTTRADIAPAIDKVWETLENR